MTEIAIYDQTGQPQTLEWARLKYGPFVIYPAAPSADGSPGPVWRLTTLREKNDSTFIAKARAENGAPLPGPRICWYWPDAPDLPTAGPLGAPFEGIKPGVAVSGYANASGDVGFPMGPGALYHPENGERGPHAAWMHGLETRSDVLLGVGMIPDDHLHLDAEWTLTVDDGEEPEPEDPELSAALHALADAVRILAAAVEGLTNDS